MSSLCKRVLVLTMYQVQVLSHMYTQATENPLKVCSLTIRLKRHKNTYFFFNKTAIWKPSQLSSDNNVVSEGNGQRFRASGVAQWISG